jgi:hypothetical protein
MDSDLIFSYARRLLNLKKVSQNQNWKVWKFEELGSNWAQTTPPKNLQIDLKRGLEVLLKRENHTTLGGTSTHSQHSPLLLYPPYFGPVPTMPLFLTCFTNNFVTDLCSPSTSLPPFIMWLPILSSPCVASLCESESMWPLVASSL